MADLDGITLTFEAEWVVNDLIPALREFQPSSLVLAHLLETSIKHVTEEDFDIQDHFAPDTLVVTQLDEDTDFDIRNLL